MDWYVADRRLAPLFKGAPRLVGEGFWVPASEPIPIASFLDEALTEAEREEYEGSFDAWPAHVEMVLEESEARRDGVLSCFWSSAPGLSSADGLTLIGLEERAYLCFWDDWGDGHRAIACLQPGFDRAVVDDVVERVLVSNGHDFGVWVFGSPPNEWSGSVSDAVLTRAFEAMRDEHDDDGEWAEFLGERFRDRRGGMVMTSEQRLILRQGDVILIQADELPDDAEREPASAVLVLAEGEATGHAHAVRSKRASLHRLPDWEERYLVVEGTRPVALRHEEHDPIAIPPGVWEVRRQREYNPGREGWVAD